MMTMTRSDKIVLMTIPLMIVGYFTMLASGITKTLKNSNEETVTCCMKIPYTYMGRTHEVCYNGDADTTYNNIEQQVLRQWQNILR